MITLPFSSTVVGKQYSLTYLPAVYTSTAAAVVRVAWVGGMDDGVLFCLEDQVVPLPKKLQKVPHNSTVCKKVELVTVLSRESISNTENTLTSVLITPGFIFVIYAPGY